MSGMVWNENSNVCGLPSRAADAPPKVDSANATTKSQTTNASSQPLARNECGKAGMKWNDSSNVCSENSGIESAAKTSIPVPSTILINIDKTKQQMTVFLDGVESYNWPVSTGKVGYSTPSGTFTARSMNEIWYSKEWDNAPMPHAIFFMKDGHAIHGSYEVKNLGKARVAWLRAYFAAERRDALRAGRENWAKEYAGRAGWRCSWRPS